MSKPKSILKKPSGSFPTASSSKHPARSPQNGAKGKANGNAKAGGSKLRQSISVKPSQRRSKRPREESNESDSGDDVDGADGAEDGDDFGEDSELDTDEEISRSKEDGKKTVRTKRKAPTTAETFGTTLTALLSEAGPSKRTKTESTPVEGPSEPITAPKRSEKKPSKPSFTNPILSLSHTKLPPSKASVSLERRAARKVKEEKEEKEDRARVKDVVEGWTAADGTGGMEFEKGLRKVAQKGVIKLFNAILVASKSSETTATTLSAKAGLKEEKGRRKEKDNVLGRGGKVSEGKGLTSESFLDLVRKG